MLGPHQSPIDLAWINLTNSIIFELWKFIILAYVKSRGAEDYLKVRAELKLFGRKLDFWDLIEKLETRRALENWSFRVYLDIRLLEIGCKNGNFQKLNLKEVGILKTIWGLGILKKD